MRLLSCSNSRIHKGNKSSTKPKTNKQINHHTETKLCYLFTCNWFSDPCSIFHLSWCLAPVLCPSHVLDL